MWSDLANYGTFASGVTAVILLFLTLREYRRQGAQKRADYFKAMMDKFKTTPGFLDISSYLDEDENPKLNDVPYPIRRSYLNFFEELALMVNSGLVQRELALYMFGYYAIRARHNHYFKSEFAFDGPYWSLFVRFAEELEREQSSRKFQKANFAF